MKCRCIFGGDFPDFMFVFEGGNFMGLNFRKSISLFKGVKLNLGTKSAGLSFGVKGARYSVNTNGTRRATFGIPGTGLSYTKTFGGKKSTLKKGAFMIFQAHSKRFL